MAFAMPALLANACMSPVRRRTARQWRPATNFMASPKRSYSIAAFTIPQLETYSIVLHLATACLILSHEFRASKERNLRKSSAELPLRPEIERVPLLPPRGVPRRDNGSPSELDDQLFYVSHVRQQLDAFNWPSHRCRQLPDRRVWRERQHARGHASKWPRE